MIENSKYVSYYYLFDVFARHAGVLLLILSILDTNTDGET